MCVQIYPNDLEESFNKFEDLAQTFHLYRGKGSRDPEELAGESVGLLKVCRHLPTLLPLPSLSLQSLLSSKTYTHLSSLSFCPTSFSPLFGLSLY